MKLPKRRPKTTLTIRVPKKLLEEIRNSATGDDRSVTSFVTKAIREELQREAATGAIQTCVICMAPGHEALRLPSGARLCPFKIDVHSPR